MNANLKEQFGEDAVNEVASNTYLKYCCFQNPMDEKWSKRGICDLLIFFKQTAIIISVKNYEFN